MMKKFLSLLLAFSLFLGALPALAEDAAASSPFASAAIPEAPEGFDYVRIEELGMSLPVPENFFSFTRGSADPAAFYSFLFPDAEITDETYLSEDWIAIEESLTLLETGMIAGDIYLWAQTSDGSIILQLDAMAADPELESKVRSGALAEYAQTFVEGLQSLGCTMDVGYSAYVKNAPCVLVRYYDPQSSINIAALHTIRNGVAMTISLQCPATMEVDDSYLQLLAQTFALAAYDRGVAIGLATPAISFMLPSWFIVSDATDDNDLYFTLTGTDAQSMRSYLSQNGVTVDAISDDFTQEIFISVSKSEKVDRKYVQNGEGYDKLVREITSRFSQSGAEILAHEPYENELGRWVYLQVAQDGLCASRYFTVIDDVNITFTFTSYTGEVTDAQEALLLAVVDSVQPY